MPAHPVHIVRVHDDELVVRRAVLKGVHRRLGVGEDVGHNLEGRAVVDEGGGAALTRCYHHETHHVAAPA